MKIQPNYINRGLVFLSISFLMFLFAFINVSAEAIDWIKVANTNNEIQYVDINSIKYNNKGLLSVIIKYSEINPEDNKIINTSSYLMAVDCEKRLFSKLPVNGELRQVKSWEDPVNDKLIKKTIIQSCSY